MPHAVAHKDRLHMGCDKDSLEVVREVAPLRGVRRGRKAKPIAEDQGMTATIEAVYRDGAFHPIGPAPELSEGSLARISFIATHPVDPPHDPVAVRAMLKAIADLPEEEGGDKTITGRDHDKFLYGGPNGAL